MKHSCMLDEVSKQKVRGLLSGPPVIEGAHKDKRFLDYPLGPVMHVSLVWGCVVGALTGM